MNPDLGSDTSPVWNIYALFLGSFAEKPLVVSQSVDWFLRLKFSVES